MHLPLQEVPTMSMIQQEIDGAKALYKMDTVSCQFTIYMQTSIDRLPRFRRNYVDVLSSRIITFPYTPEMNQQSK